jgi:predicted MFS family arabinose efflux permease
MAAALFSAFGIIETRHRQPLMPWRVFSNRNRSGAYAIALSVGAALFAVFFFLTLFVQNILGYSPLQAGLGFLPLSIGITIMSILISRFIGKTGPRLPMTFGALVAAGGLYWMSRLMPSSGYVSAVLGPTLVLATGLGLLFVPMTLTAVAGIRQEDTGLASALLNTGQQVGGSLGLAILVNVAVSVTNSQVQGGVPQLPAITAGYSRAFEIAAGFYIIAFIIAFISIRTPRYGPSPPSNTPSGE